MLIKDPHLPSLKLRQDEPYLLSRKEASPTNGREDKNKELLPLVK